MGMGCLFLYYAVKLSWVIKVAVVTGRITTMFFYEKYNMNLKIIGCPCKYILIFLQSETGIYF